MENGYVDKRLRRKSLNWYAAMNIANIFISQFALMYFSSFVSYLFEDYSVYEKISSVTSYAAYVKLAALVAGAYLAQKMFFTTGKITPLYKKVRWILFIATAGCFVDVSFLGAGFSMVYYPVVYLVYQAGIALLSPIQIAMFLILAGADMDDRVYATSRTVITGFFATFIGSFILSNVTNLFLYTADGMMNMWGYLIASAVMGAIFLIGSELIIRNISSVEEETSHLPRNPVSRSSFGEMVKDVFTNAPYAAYWIHSLASYIASAITSSLVMYYWWGIGAFADYALGSSITSMISVFGSPVVALAAKKFLGKKKALYVSAVMEVVMRLMSFVALKISIWAFCVTNGLAMVMGAINNAYGLNYSLDSAEISMRKTGRDSRIFMVSMLSVSSYISSFIASPARNFIMDVIGYDEVNSYRILGSTVPDALWEVVGGKLAVCMSVIPAMIALVGAICLFVMYKTSDEEAVVNAIENEKYLRM
ncbi:MAG: MFS transporter [Eubacteriaceae bacterium]|nr:MFS transporter [Eubacteriaceae bacterium]